MITALGWIASVFSFTGFFANIKKSKWGFFLWGLSDIVLIIISVNKELWPLVLMYVIYFFLAVWGFWRWSK